MSKAETFIEVMKTIDEIKPIGILVCGLNGAGKTTFARELAKKIAYKHMDIEDYFFLDSIIPYTNSRTKNECAALLLEDINKNPKFVLSSVIGDFGDEITGHFDLAIMLGLPLDERLRRIKKRDFERFNERILPGGDMYESEQKFYDFVKSRPKSYVENWLKTLSCPIIIIDKSED
jgi:adenylate kinase family enzyme